MRTTYGKPVRPLGHLIPGLEDNTNPTGVSQFGQMVVASWALGPSLLVDGVTYKRVGFIAPVDGCRIVAGWYSAAVKIGGGTNTLAFDNYDKSGNAARNVLEATNFDPDTLTTALEGDELTLQSTTTANLNMDAGDVLNSVLVCGTMTTDGEGYTATFVVWVPYPANV